MVKIEAGDCLEPNALRRLPEGARPLEQQSQKVRSFSRSVFKCLKKARLRILTPSNRESEKVAFAALY